MADKRVVRTRYSRYGRRKCRFCSDEVEYIDYKDLSTLRRYITDKGKIRTKRSTGTCAKHQRRLARAIKRARYMALLPYVVEHFRS